MRKVLNRTLQTFRMDLGNKKHREAFRQGDIPEGVSVGRPMNETRAARIIIQ